MSRPTPRWRSLPRSSISSRRSSATLRRPANPMTRPTRAEAPDAEAFTPSHTLAEDAARVTDRNRRTDPSRNSRSGRLGARDTRPEEGTVVRLRPAGFAPTADRATAAARRARAAPQARHRPPAGSPGAGGRHSPRRRLAQGPEARQGAPTEEHGTDDAVAGGDAMGRPPDRAPRLVVRRTLPPPIERGAGRGSPARGAGAHRGRGECGESHPCGLRADRLRDARARARNRAEPAPAPEPEPSRATAPGARAGGAGPATALHDAPGLHRPLGRRSPTCPPAPRSNGPPATHWTRSRRRQQRRRRDVPWSLPPSRPRTPRSPPRGRRSAPGGPPRPARRRRGPFPTPTSRPRSWPPPRPSGPRCRSRLSWPPFGPSRLSGFWTAAPSASATAAPCRSRRKPATAAAAGRGRADDPPPRPVPARR